MKRISTAVITLVTRQGYMPLKSALSNNDTTNAEEFDADRKSVGAVFLMDRGIVFLKTTNPDKRFLFSNLCSALLLQEKIEDYETLF